jgi:hypothetical protein
MKRPSLLFCILIGCFIVSPSFAATGPVPAGSLPGGAIVTDDDPGPGEAWGRPGGRNYGYSGFVLSNFTLLEWQSISAAMSFDGPVDTAGEIMTVSSLGPTSVIYTGSTMVELPAPTGLTSVDTRFTVTLTGATFISGTTRVNVLANSSFSVNVLFEALDPITGSWGPALDVFDNLPTPHPPAENLANTSFEQGFFFDAVADLSVAEHDDNMQARADEIVGKLDFLTLEEAGHFAQLVAEHADLSAKLDALLTAGGNEQQLQVIQALVAENNQKLMDLLFSVNGLPSTDQLNSVRDDLTALIACLWIGFLCPDEVPPDVPNLNLVAMDVVEILDGIDWVKDDVQAINEQLADIVEKLDTFVIPAAVELEVTHSNAASSSSQVFLVLSKVNGVPVTAALSVTAAPVSGPSGFSLVPVSSTSVELAPGVQQVTAELNGSLNKTNTFLISAELLLPDDTVQYGATLTSTHDVAD